MASVRGSGSLLLVPELLSVPRATMKMEKMKPIRNSHAQPLVFFCSGWPQAGQVSAFGLMDFLQEGQFFMLIYLRVQRFFVEAYLLITRLSQKR